MKRLIHYVLLLFITVMTLSGCDLHNPNPILKDALIHFNNATNYSSEQNFDVTFEDGTSVSEQWILNRDNDTYWLMNPRSTFQLYREPSEVSYKQYTRYFLVGDFNPNTLFKVEDYLLDLSDMNPDWFDQQDTQNYQATERSLENRFRFIFESRYLEMNDIEIEFTFTEFSIALDEFDHISQIEYAVSTNQEFSFHVTYDFSDYAITHIQRPIEVGYPDAFDRLVDLQENYSSKWYQLTIERDGEFLYELHKNGSYFTFQEAGHETIRHGFAYAGYFALFELEGDHIASFEPFLKYDFYPDFLDELDYDYFFEIIQENPLRIRLSDEKASRLIRVQWEPEWYGLEDEPCEYKNVIYEWQEGGDIVSLEFDRISKEGETSHWLFEYDVAIDSTLNPDFVARRFSLDLLYQFYDHIGSRIVTLSAKNLTNRYSSSYRIRQEDNHLSLSSSSTVMPDTSLIRVHELLGKEVWINDDGSLSYQPWDIRDPLVTVTNDELQIPFEYLDIAQWNSDWFIAYPDRNEWEIHPDYMEEFLGKTGYDFLFKERPIHIESMTLIYADNLLELTIKGTLPNQDEFEFEQYYYVGPV